MGGSMVGQSRCSRASTRGRKPKRRARRVRYFGGSSDHTVHMRCLLHGVQQPTGSTAADRSRGSAPTDPEQLVGLGAELAYVLISLPLVVFHPPNGLVVAIARLILVTQMPVRHCQKEPVGGVAALAELR